MFTAFIQELRPWQWLKNLLLFAGILFSRQLFNPALFVTVFGGFILFCAISSCGYVLNDLNDRTEDREHPEKRMRPLASGKVPVAFAVSFAMIALLAALPLAFFLSTGFGWCALSYFLLMLAYTVVLRSVVILDVLAISSGYVLRAVAGAVLIGAEISPWLLICTMALALFIVLCKRRHEVMLVGDNAVSSRKLLNEYPIQFVDRMITVAASSVIITYMLYTLSERTIHLYGTSNLVYTSPIVIYAIFRYLYLVIKKHEGGAPETLLFRDIGILGAIIVWFAAILTIVYFR